MLTKLKIKIHLLGSHNSPHWYILWLSRLLWSVINWFEKTWTGNPLPLPPPPPKTITITTCSINIYRVWSLSYSFRKKPCWTNHLKNYQKINYICVKLLQSSGSQSETFTTLLLTIKLLSTVGIKKMSWIFHSPRDVSDVLVFRKFFNNNFWLKSLKKSIQKQNSFALKSCNTDSKVRNQQFGHEHQQGFLISKSNINTLVQNGITVSSDWMALCNLEYMQKY